MKWPESHNAASIKVNYWQLITKLELIPANNYFNEQTTPKKQNNHSRNNFWVVIF